MLEVNGRCTTGVLVVKRLTVNAGNGQEENTEDDFRGKWFEGVDLINLVRDIDKRRELVNMVKNLRFRRSRKRLA